MHVQTSYACLFVEIDMKAAVFLYVPNIIGKSYKYMQFKFQYAASVVGLHLQLARYCTESCSDMVRINWYMPERGLSWV